MNGQAIMRMVIFFVHVKRSETNVNFLKINLMNHFLLVKSVKNYHDVIFQVYLLIFLE